LIELSAQDHNTCRPEDDCSVVFDRLEAHTRTIRIIGVTAVVIAELLLPVAGFVASTLVSLICAALVSVGIKRGVEFFFALSLIAGSLGLFAIRHTPCSFLAGKLLAERLRLRSMCPNN
jgi:hypothetical protein